MNSLSKTVHIVNTNENELTFDVRTCILRVVYKCSHVLILSLLKT